MSRTFFFPLSIFPPFCFVDWLVSINMFGTQCQSSLIQFSVCNDVLSSFFFRVLSIVPFLFGVWMLIFYRIFHVCSFLFRPVRRKLGFSGVVVVFSVKFGWTFF